MLFTPIKIGSLTLRNRYIRPAAFEGMSQSLGIIQAFIDYHGFFAFIKYEYLSE